MLCIMASTFITQSTTSQHLVRIDSITLFKICLLIPTWSTSHFVNSHFVGIDKVTKWELDQMGIDKVGIDEVGMNCSKILISDQGCDFMNELTTVCNYQHWALDCLAKLVDDSQTDWDEKIKSSWLHDILTSIYQVSPPFINRCVCQLTGVGILIWSGRWWRSWPKESEHQKLYGRAKKKHMTETWDKSTSPGNRSRIPTKSREREGSGTTVAWPKTLCIEILERACMKSKIRNGSW